ncbi:hypothetical protein MW887_002774 [Aspergillus wentii]|nr:hypothetical protein MW887_002774 [Aspergillus wentii]
MAEVDDLNGHSGDYLLPTGYNPRRPSITIEPPPGGSSVGTSRLFSHPSSHMPPSPSSHTTNAEQSFSAYDLHDSFTGPVADYLGVADPVDLLGIGYNYGDPTIHPDNLDGISPNTIVPDTGLLSQRAPSVTYHDRMCHLENELERLKGTTQNNISHLNADQVSEMWSLLKRHFDAIEGMVHKKVNFWGETSAPATPSNVSSNARAQYICKLCSPARRGTFLNRGTFARHIAHKHAPRSRYHCFFPECPWTGSRRDKIHEHLRMRHRYYESLSPAVVNGLKRLMQSPRECALCSTPVSSWEAYFECVCTHCHISEDDATESNSSLSRRGSGGNGGGSGNGYNGPPPDGYGGGGGGGSQFPPQNGYYNNPYNGGSFFPNQGYSFANGRNPNTEHSPMDATNDAGLNSRFPSEPNPSHSPRTGNGGTAVPCKEEEISPLSLTPPQPRFFSGSMLPGEIHPKKARPSPVEQRPGKDPKHVLKEDPQRKRKTCGYEFGGCSEGKLSNQAGDTRRQSAQKKEARASFPSHGYSQFQGSFCEVTPKRPMRMNNSVGQAPSFYGPGTGGFKGHVKGPNSCQISARSYNQKKNLGQWTAGAIRNVWKDPMKNAQLTSPTEDTQALVALNTTATPGKASISQQAFTEAAMALPIRLNGLSGPDSNASTSVLSPRKQMGSMGSVSNDTHSKVNKPTPKGYRAVKSSPGTKKNGNPFTIDLIACVDVYRPGRLRSKSTEMHSAMEITDGTDFADPKPQDIDFSQVPLDLSYESMLLGSLDAGIMNGLSFGNLSELDLRGDDDLPQNAMLFGC